MNKNRPEECRGLAERNMWHRDGNARPELEHSRGDWHFTQTLKRHFEGEKKKAFLFSSCCVGVSLGYCLYSRMSWLSRLI